MKNVPGSQCSLVQCNVV